MKFRTTLLAALGFVFLVASPGFAAAPVPLYIQFSPSATKGALYYPDTAVTPNPHIAIIVIHRNSNFLNHISTVEMPKRGFVVLGMNPRCDNNESICAPWENNALDVKSGVNYLRKLPGITKVILLGHSGGGPTMSFYEAVAENGVAFCQANKLIDCDSTLAGLPKADGIIIMDGHPGNGINEVRSINPAVVNDAAILDHNATARINPNLDPFNTANGYNPNGPTVYSEAFKKKYFKAQSDRMNGLIAIAEDRLSQIRRGIYKYPAYTDDAIVIPMADGGRLSQLDMTVDHSTEKPQKLMKNDGTIDASNVVESVRVPSLAPNVTTQFGSTAFLQLKSFLSVRAIRSTNSQDGLIWCSSNNSTPCAIQKISVPILVTAMGGHYFIRDSEVYYDLATTKDKDFVVIEGATHGGTECTACEITPGQYSNATKNLFDYMASWINKRY